MDEIASSSGPVTISACSKYPKKDAETFHTMFPSKAKINTVLPADVPRSRTRPLSARDIQAILIPNLYFYIYSLQQKQCTTALNKKSRVFFQVNIFEILHASTYDYYKYIYKVKKPAAESMQPPAAARRGHSICTRAHYTCTICSIEEGKLWSCFLVYYV